MLPRTCFLLLFTLPVLAGCDPLYTTQYRQALAPAPAPSCVAAALRGSPLAAVVWRDTTDRSPGARSNYVVTVRDSLTIGGRWSAHVVEGGAGDSAWVRLAYSYMSYHTPRPAERARRAAQARELLEHVRVRCAPATPREVQCKSAGGVGGQRDACAPAPEPGAAVDVAPRG